MLPRMPCYSNEPVNFIYTSQSFIADHNDIFNDQVIAFMATAVSKAIYERTAGASYYRECHDRCGKNFSFGKCFDFHYPQSHGHAPAAATATRNPAPAANRTSSMKTSLACS